jgi:hypothetical protein
MRLVRSPSTAVSMIALAVSLFALLLLPLLREDSGRANPVAPAPFGNQAPPSAAPVAAVQAPVIPGRIFLIEAKFGGEDEPFGKFLWVEVTVAVIALSIALALGFLTSRWASVGRVVGAGLAVSALGLLPGTLRQAAGLNYTSLSWGYPIAVTAGLVALVAAVVAALIAFRGIAFRQWPGSEEGG